MTDPCFPTPDSLREWVHFENKHDTPDATRFRVLQLNCLDPDTADTKFPHIAKHVISWKNRRQRVVEELVRYDADFICLEELPHYDWEEHFKPFMTMHGYSGKYDMEKTVDGGYCHCNKGCAVLWNNAVWEHRDRELAVVNYVDIEECKHFFLRLDFNVKHRIVLGNFMHRETYKHVVVVSTCFRAGDSDMCVTIRNAQRQALERVLNEGYNGISMIVAGQFWEEPARVEPFDTNNITTSIPFSDFWNRDVKKHLPHIQQRTRSSDVINDMMSCCWKSAYQHTQYVAPYTETTGNPTDKDPFVASDYIWSRTDVSPVAVLGVPPVDKLPNAPALPPYYPSSHISLVADYVLHPEVDSPSSSDSESDNDN